MAKNSLLINKSISRREFFRTSLLGACFSLLYPYTRNLRAAEPPSNDLFWVKNIPDYPFVCGGNGNYHAGLESLLDLMGSRGLKFYRSSQETNLSGSLGLIEPNDVVLIKVNAQWKYRGCTNSDLIRGLIQRILDHPDGFSGEVVIFENGQDRGSLNCDTSSSYEGDTEVHANANDDSHSFLYLVDTIFNDPRVSAYLLDPIRKTFIGENDHTTQGYRIYENVSYPCFTSTGGHRIELREGIWNGSGYSQNLKLINVPVLKHHDVGGSEITESLKHFYGIVSMADGQRTFRHYAYMGEHCGKMVVSVRTPVLNVIDAIWVSHLALRGYPEETTFRANQLMASQDPVALDYMAAKYILYPIDENPRHHPDFSGIDTWLTGARDIINARGGLYNHDCGIVVDQVTKTEAEIQTSLCGAASYYVFGASDFNGDGVSEVAIWRPINGSWYIRTIGAFQWGQEGDIPVPGDYNGDGATQIAVWRPSTGRWFIKDTSLQTYKWGAAGDIPVPGDYNDDGVTEIAIWRPSNGKWYIRNVGIFQWGRPGDIPVPGDYNGDGATQIAVWRPSTGQWFIKDTALQTYTWGAAGDIPVPGDYNGDGATQIAVWRPSTGQWFIKDTTVQTYTWGAGGDIPLVR